MSTFKKSTVKIAGKNRNVYLINYTPDNETEAKTIDKMHHIHILDRSYSMSGDIVGLMEDVKKTFRAIPVGDYISVVWFSSEGENGVVIKGYKKTENDDFGDVDNLIDSIKHCVGCTCFSEPMALVKSIINEMQPLCPYYNVTLFTDGCSCCSVSTEEDYKRTYDITRSFKDDIMALNTLGYGYYYDKDFLASLAEISEFGKYIHSSNVKEYSEIFTHNYERVKDMIVDKVDIVAPNYDIIYLNSKSSKLSKSEMHLSSIDKRKNQFLLIEPDEETLATVTINGKDILDYDIQKGKILDSTLLNLQYALAYEAYYKGDRETCLDILKDIKDKHFIDEQLKAFTIDETSQFLKSLNKAIFVNKERMKNGEAPENYVPADDAFCIMDLLKILSSEGNFYVPEMGSYNRIGLQVVDTFNLFEPDRDYEILAPFNDNLTFNKSKLNVSIKFTRNGVVSINPKSAKKVGLPEKIDSYQFQTHTIIKDGHLNMDKIKVKLSNETIRKLSEIQLDLIGSDGVEFLNSVSGNIFEIVLTTLPIINRQYLKDSEINKVLDKVIENTKLEIEQKVIKYMISNNSYKDTIVEVSNNGTTATYNEEQIEVLKEHGLNEYLAYAGINRKVTEKNENDYYEARELEFQLKGCSAIPAIEKGLETYNKAIEKGKDPNFMSSMIYNTIRNTQIRLESMGFDKDSKEERQELESILKNIKTKLINNRIELNTIKMSKVLTSSWWEELVIDKDKYNYTRDNNTLVVKTSYEKVYFN